MAKATHGIGIPGRTHRLFAVFTLLAFFGLSLRPVVAQSSTPAPTPVLQPVSGDAPHTTLQPLRSDSTLTPEQLGDLQMVRKQYQAAIQVYQGIFPKSASIWNKLGIANQQMYVTEEAKKDYQNALKIDPHNPDVMNNLGSVYYSMKEYGSAERMYRKALKIKPNSALIYKNLGTNLLAADKFKKGWECYQTALTIDPEIFERVNQLRIGEPTPTQKRGAMNYYLARSYARVGMPDLAVGYLRMAIDEGFTDRKKVMADKEFASLRGLSAFERLIAEQQVQ